MLKARPISAMLMAAALAAVFSACARRLPARDSEFYPKYRGREVTVARPGELTYDGDAPRGARRFAFRDPPKAIDVDPLNPEKAFSSRPKALFDRPETLRPVAAGERILVREIVRVEGLGGVWADAVLLADGEECLIPADGGLARRLLFTDEELAGWRTVPEEVRRLVVARRIRVGMTTAQVRAAWGEPDLATRKTGPGGEALDMWTYRRGPRSLVYLEFADGKLESWTK